MYEVRPWLRLGRGKPHITNVIGHNADAARSLPAAERLLDQGLTL
jgi:hypothetical protein